MKKSLVYFLQKIPLEGIEQEILIQQIYEDIEIGTGPFAGYSSNSYGRKKADDALDHLIENGIVKLENDSILFSPDALQLWKDYSFVKADNIQEQLDGFLSKGNALRLHVLLKALDSGPSHKIIQSLEEDNWSQNACKLAIEDLDARGFFDGDIKWELNIQPELHQAVQEWYAHHRKDVYRLIAEKGREDQLTDLVSKKEFQNQRAFNASVFRKIFFMLYDHLKANGIETLDFNEDLMSLFFVFNQQSYEIRFQDKLNTYPYSEADFCACVSMKLEKSLFQNYWNPYQDKRERVAFFGLEDGLHLSSEQNPIFMEVSHLLKTVSKPLPQSFPLEFTNKVVSEYFKNLQNEVELWRNRFQQQEAQEFEQGFVFTQPNLPWSLMLKIPELLEQSKREVLISSPYLTTYSFSFLQNVQDYVAVKIIATIDYRLKDKVKKKKILDPEAIEKILTGKNVEIRKLPDLHSRFMIIDGSQVFFLSSDLQMNQLQSKFQYGFWTSDHSIVRSTCEYFDIIWQEAEHWDLITELRDQN